MLDPIERGLEILFGVIMVMTFTGSISVANGGAAEARTVLAAAIGSNLAWGIVDATMYLVANFTERARNTATLHAIRDGRRNDDARRLIVDALPPAVAMVLTPLEVDTLRARLQQKAAVPTAVRLTRDDLTGAAGVFLLVFLAIFPLVVPFLFIHDTRAALRASNAVGIAVLFATGWSLGSYSGRPRWRTGLGMVTVGVLLVGITVALGG